MKLPMMCAGLFGLFLLPANAAAGPHAPLLEVCEDFGVTPPVCVCYLGEVNRIFPKRDVTLASGVANAFMKGEEPEAIAAYLLLTRKLSVTHAHALYRLADKNIDKIGDLCDDPDAKITPRMEAKRKAMTKRLEGIGRRYRLGK